MIFVRSIHLNRKMFDSGPYLQVLLSTRFIFFWDLRIRTQQFVWNFDGIANYAACIFSSEPHDVRWLWCAGICLLLRGRRMDSNHKFLFFALRNDSHEKNENFCNLHEALVSYKKIFIRNFTDANKLLEFVLEHKITSNVSTNSFQTSQNEILVHVIIRKKWFRQNVNDVNVTDSVYVTSVKSSVDDE